MARRATATDRVAGRVVKQRREAAGLSQSALGKQIGRTFQQVQKYEKGTNRMALSIFIETAGAVGMTPQALLSEVVEKL